MMKPDVVSTTVLPDKLKLYIHYSMYYTILAGDYTRV